MADRVVYIEAIAGYLPYRRLQRATVAETWSAPAIPGERAIAGADEDAVTMGAAAAERALRDIDRDTIDAVYLATTSPPYAERQTGPILAAALGLRDDIATADVGDSLRAGTAALRAARDVVAAGHARRALVVVADRRVGAPDSVTEQLYGDGAAAVVVAEAGPTALATIDHITSYAEDVSSGWRRQGDRYVRSYAIKHELEYGFVRPLTEALRRAADASETDLTSARLAIPSVDGRVQFRIAKQLGLQLDRVGDPLALAIGVLGTPAAFIALVSVLEAASDGDRVLLGAAGEGADAIVLTVRSSLPANAWRTSEISQRRRSVTSYGELVRAHDLMSLDEPRLDASPVTYWRDRDTYLGLYGMRCTRCELVQYPTARVCPNCRGVDTGEDIRLQRRGTVFSYTFDHIVAASYSTVPVPRALIDLEGGGRILTTLTDCEPDDIAIGMPVELVFRAMNDAGAFRNYYWKARPILDPQQEAAA